MTTWNSWLRSIGAVLLAVAAVLPVHGADLGTELDELASAISARLGEATEKKESKKLEKAEKKLAAASPTDVKALSKILSAVFGSKTVDAVVLAEAQDVLDCVRQLASDQKVEAQSFLGQLEAKFAGRLEAKIASGDKRLDAGVALVTENPKKAAALFRKAFEKYVKSRAFAEKALQRQNAGPKLGNKPRVIATLQGGGETKRLSEYGVRFFEFGQLSVLGCDAQGPDDVCRTSLSFSFLYGEDSHETGVSKQVFAYYNESSDFGNGNGPGVQDRRWQGTLVVVVTESTNSRIKGTIKGELTADSGHAPPTLTVDGTFVVKR